MSHIHALIVRRKSLQEINVLIFSQSDGMNMHPPVPIETLDFLKNVLRLGVCRVSVRDKEDLIDLTKLECLLKSTESVRVSARGELL